MRPFVKPGERLGFARDLAERGLMPPRLHEPKDRNVDTPVATPYLVIPAFASDNGSRPLRNSQAFHSQGVWLEDAAGAVVATPVLGGAYRVKAQVKNLGAFASYGGMTEFFVSTPAACTAAAGTTTPLPALGRGGLALLPGNTVTVECPALWRPTVPSDLLSAIVVQAFDPFADNLVRRYDAVADRHVGRRDLTSDFFVRDWTDSATVHDNGAEPSARAAFYVTSDVWNRRSNAPGAFVNDQPANEPPQAGAGAAGDNVAFARISRTNTATEETVQARFLYAEFGTGSPFQNCSSAPDPTVTFHVGDGTQLVSLPWHLPPTSSTHLCLAVQISTAADPYVPPGLLGNTPGWPTTDLMVINDNNKAQRNMTVYDAGAGTDGLYYGVFFNAATFVRDVVVRVDVDARSLALLRNPRVSVAGSATPIEFKPGASFTIPGVLPGERRWIAFGHDSFTGKTGQTASVLFNEVVDKTVVNGYAIGLRGATEATLLSSTVAFQSYVFYRFAAGMNAPSAGRGLELTTRLLRAPDGKAYLDALPDTLTLLASSLAESSAAYGGVKDGFGVGDTLARLRGASRDQKLGGLLAVHARLLHQVDAWQTQTVLSRGDEAAIPFTARLQAAVLQSDRLRDASGLPELLKATRQFTQGLNAEKTRPQDIAKLIKQSLRTLRAAVDLLGGPANLVARGDALEKSLSGPPNQMQLAHQSLLTGLLVSLTKGGG